MTALNKKLARDLLHLRGQVVAVALVVACGIATYVTMRSSYEALLDSQADYYTSYRFADIFANLKRAPETIATEIAAIPGVSAVQTRVVFDVTLDVPGLAEPATGRLISIPEASRPALNDLFIHHGRYIEPNRRNEIIISQTFAEANNLEVGQSIGAVINGRWERLQIAGTAYSPEYIHEIRGADVFPDKRRFGVMWMSHDAMGPAFNMEGSFNDVALLLSPGATAQSVIDRLDHLLERYGGLGAFTREEQVSHRFLSDEIAQDRITSLVVPPIFLGVAAFLINMVLARLVSTQRDQIAILKAFGYGNASIGYHYLKFAIVAVLLGTALGTALGAWFGAGLAELYKQYFKFPALRFSVNPDTVGLAMAISAAAAFIGAVSAVRRVTSLPPAEAMRPEPPAKFRAGLIERIGFQKLLSPAARMIVRNLERRPIKASMSVFGIAMAVAVLFIGHYFLDALNYIIEVQFRTAQREDVAIVFHNPRASGIRSNIEQLPGVMRSEPFRAVPARLRFEHRSKRIAILGIEPEGSLRLLLDNNLNAIGVPPEGLTLTTNLAGILGVKEGDTLTVEVLEGERPVRQIEVVRLVDELIGTSAYMNARALNRLMREGGTISGAYLKVDERAAPELYSFLKRTPAIGGVAIREAMLNSFTETIAESLSISTTMLVTFACIIAFAVVYNSARIALSERGNEMASLRVLGFTKGEIAVMLLGEQAILIALAIPIGYGLGYLLCAVLVLSLQTELYRLPLVISGQNFIFAFGVIMAAAILSGLLVIGRLNRLDLVAVLKTRE